ncbi:MAG TPA: alginate export family protein [Alphaproteobacteria bacterium]|nr:alginate export family protein [Alphaproteobacteria bacterium]
MRADPAAADSLSEAFTEGTPSLEVRPRYEFVDQNGKAGAEAFTMRTLLGFSTKSIDDFGATLQIINVADFAGNYNSLVNGKTRYASIPDPSATNVNQAYLTYSGVPDTVVTAGRQIINLDDTRFIGNVDFRQNMQTFDALTATAKPLPDLKFVAGYSWGIKNVVNRHLPARIFIAEGYWTPSQTIAVEAFGYWYGNEAGSVIAGAAGCGITGAQACNSATYGLRAHGEVPLPSDFKLEYKATYAHQTSYDGGSSLIDADFFQALGKVRWQNFNAGVEYMLMGGNGAGTYGFQTPLATRHAFNGWAEVFLTTPPGGLSTVDAFVGADISGVTAAAKYYRFRSDYKDQSYGDEWDLSLTYKFSDRLQAGVEYADYHADGFGASTQAGWLFGKVTY